MSTEKNVVKAKEEVIGENVRNPADQDHSKISRGCER